MSDIKRRDFIALCGGAAVGWPLAARAQPAARMRRIGTLLFAGREQEGISPFLQGLEALGYIDGKTVTIEYRDAAGTYERGSQPGQELGRLQPNLVLL